LSPRHASALRGNPLRNAVHYQINARHEVGTVIMVRQLRGHGVGERTTEEVQLDVSQIR